MDTLTLEKEVLEALQCIKNGENFILEGGAGSGKTYSLISLINALTEELPDIKIVCITYTNNAVAEILSRIENSIGNFIFFLLFFMKLKISSILNFCSLPSLSTKAIIPNALKIATSIACLIRNTDADE